MICYEKSCNSVAMGYGPGLCQEMRNDGLHMCPLIAKTTRVMSMPYRVEMKFMNMGLTFANIYKAADHYKATFYATYNEIIYSDTCL